MSTQNLNTAPHYSPAAEAFLDTIAGAQYPSELRGRGPEIAQAVVGHEITAEESTVVFRALMHCKELMKPGSTLNRTAEKPWSPSDALSTMQSRDLDVRERQLPNGDRD